MKSRARPSLPLFVPTGGPPSAADIMAARFDAFAEAFAKHQRGREADVAAFETALRAYHTTWALCARDVPSLDEGAVRSALAAYARRKGVRAKRAA